MSQTLLLAQSYEPIKIISWQRAITLLTLGKVEVVENYDDDIRSPTVIFKMPAVVRLLNAFRRHKKPVKFSRVNVYARDKYRCGYCHEKITLASATYDHIVPRAQGGKTVWENIVTSCGICNERKGGRTPAQAGMKLREIPKRPIWVSVMTFRVSEKSVPDAWRDYLYWTSALISDE